MLNKPTELRRLEVDVLCDHQWGDSLHTRGTPYSAGIVTAQNGVRVTTNGDINSDYSC